MPYYMCRYPPSRTHWRKIKAKNVKDAKSKFAEGTRYWEHKVVCKRVKASAPNKAKKLNSAWSY